MSKKRSVHVTQSDHGWNVKQGGVNSPLSTHQTQAEAIESAKGFARATQAELRIHGRDGKIRETMSYGNDPFPPRDRD